jgi:hypothetical protein
MLEDSNSSDLFINDSNATGSTSNAVKLRSVGKIYNYLAQYEQEETARSAILNEAGFFENKWKEGRKVLNAKGATHWFNCSEAISCNIKLQLNIDNLNDKCTVMVEEGEHDHSKTTKACGGYGLSSEIKEYIKEYEKLNIKPKRILIALRDKTDNLPTIIQLNNFLKSIRNKKDIDGALGNRVTLNDFLNLHTENKNIPEDPDQMFVASI